MTRRNVLFIIADQFRADCLGAAGNRLIQTPNLDALAADGVLFTNCFVQTNPCGPSRSCIFSGRYLCSTRSVRNYTPMADAEENVGMWARNAGYHVAAAGYHDYAIDPRTLSEDDPRTLQLDYDNFYPGFDTLLRHDHYSPEYFDYLRARGYPEHLCGPAICSEHNIPPGGPGEHLPLHYPAHYAHEDSEGYFLASVASEFIAKETGRPWFLSVNFIKPHPPQICADPFHRMYDPADVPAANRHPGELLAPHPYYALMHRAPMLPEERDLRETRAAYYGMISEVDAYIGQLIDRLKETGQYDNTLIVFSSDHGEYMGDHYLMDKAHFYDETMRVPLIVRDPDANATRGNKVDGFCESVDITPTILEYLDVAVPDRVQGKSLLPVIRATKSDTEKDAIFFEFDFRAEAPHIPGATVSDCLLWVVRDADFKYVQFAQTSMPSLLFDLNEDPGEHRNLAADPGHAATIAQYTQRLLQWRMRNEDQRMDAWTMPFR